MHLAFVSQFDPDDPRAYSGTPLHMVQALRERVDRLSVVAPLALGDRVGGRVAKLRHRLRGEGYSRQHTAAAARALGEAATPRLRELHPDAVLAPSTLPLFGLDAPCPTACWPDATFEANLQFYPEFTGLSDAHVAEAHAVERAALDRADLVLAATAHAADSARGYYGVDEARVHVVPYGANLDEPPTEAEVAAGWAARDGGPVRLLFVGAGWVRKGGDVALRVAEEMAARGADVRLTVAGAPPPVAEHPLLEATGFLRKDVPEERDRLRRLFAESHFLCMPVRAEDFGCVFAEASAFGLPSLATDVGGLPTTLADGAGVLFRFQERPQVIAERALALLADADAYRQMAEAARRRFETVTNWGTASDRALDLIRGVL